MTYRISGAGQKSFTNSLIEFFQKVWRDDYFSKILRNKVLFLNNDDTSWRYESIGNGCVLTEEVNYLSCSHEECDTRMFYHESSIQSRNNVALRTDDTCCRLLDYQQWKN